MSKKFKPDFWIDDGLDRQYEIAKKRKVPS